MHKQASNCHSTLFLHYFAVLITHTNLHGKPKCLFWIDNKKEISFFSIRISCSFITVFLFAVRKSVYLFQWIINSWILVTTARSGCCNKIGEGHYFSLSWRWQRFFLLFICCNEVQGLPQIYFKDKTRNYKLCLSRSIEYIEMICICQVFLHKVVMDFFA